MNVFAFPHAGGDSYCYRNLRSLYKLGTFETLALPGRGKRFGEPCLLTIEEMAEEAITQFGLKNDDVNDYCFYGHSMGALLAFQTTLLLRAKNLPLPKLLFLSGRKSPRIKSSITNRHKLPSEQFKKELESLGGCPKEVLENNELMEIFEPILRADFQAVETYQSQNSDKLNIQCILFHGIQDHFSADEIKAWQTETSIDTSYHEFSGGHFFIHQESDQIIKIINQSVLAINDS